MRDHRHQGQGGGDDWNPDGDAPVPGKRTLVEASLAPRSPRGRVPAPGRVTLTAGLRAPQPASDGDAAAADSAPDDSSGGA